MLSFCVNYAAHGVFYTFTEQIEDARAFGEVGRASWIMIFFHRLVPKPFQTVHGTGKSAEERYDLKKQLKNFETGTRVSQGKTKITCLR